MTTLIVLPTPTPTPTAAPTSDTGGDAPDAGAFAALLDAVMSDGADAAPADAATGTPADGATPDPLLTLVPPLPDAADATDGAPATDAPADGSADAAPVDGLALLLTSGAVLGGTVPPGAPSSPMPEPNPDSAAEARASAPTAPSAVTGLGDATPSAAPTVTGPTSQPSSTAGTGAPTAPVSPTAPGEAPAEATPQSAEKATTDQGATPQASGAVDATTTTPAPVQTTNVDRASATTSTTAPDAPRPVSAQVLEQLDARWPAIRAAGPGTHVMTLRLEPEHFGPLRLVAHIGAEGVRIELLGSTEAARDALRQALPELKRDLVGVGLSADLDLGSRQGQQATRADGGAAGDAGARGGDRGDRPASGERVARATDRVADASLPTRSMVTAGRGRLDLIV